jgi:post-segregation antitoxin (ccd killing protein)
VQFADDFNSFLKDVVNLPQGRLDQLGGRVDVLYGAIKKDSTYGALVTGKIPQGSWAHRTIIKPKDGLEYDADFLLCVDENDDWAGDKAQYIEKLYWALGGAGYQGKCTRKTRCVRVQYANDSHIDIVPYVDTSIGQRIVNKSTGEWEDTNPEGFTDWMKKRDDWTSKNFRKVVRLMKYIRDNHGGFQGTRSIILTTLLGQRVNQVTSIIDPSAYGDVPKALEKIVSDLDDWLWPLTSMPTVEDPSSPGTSFNHRWSEESFQHFQRRVHTISSEITDALKEEDRDESARKWRIVLGDKFKSTSGESKSSSPFISTAAAGASLGRSGRAG